MARRYLPSLLFRQTLILALIAGACTLRTPAVGAGLFFLRAFVPERGGARVFLVRLLKLLVAFVIGVATTYFAMPDVPDKPSWAAVPRQAVLVEGKVNSATGLPGGLIPPHPEARPSLGRGRSTWQAPAFRVYSPSHSG